ncbi:MULTISPECIES: GNAT family N-acetyltransferase [unclassified Exiguobacterium]|uniref:GNAT family N-acetyltransferase n=1 Tax=unclassified Exiguobacterium TaxID=2644629 RepID=UPI001BEBEB0E|nr:MULTISPECIES: GNAT family N-acetyltransferase [unclassified Exiguobacterium]
MKLETQRLLVMPCTEKTMEIAIEQSYDNGPEVSFFLAELKEKPFLLYWGSWFVIRKIDGMIIGDIGFKGIPNEEKVVEIGYGILESYCNNGYATEALKVLIQWAFATSKVDKVIAETVHDNFGSIRVLEKLGMRRSSLTEKMINWEASI